MSMKQMQKENRIYLQSELLQRTDLVQHGFTSRSGGVSHGKIAGLNLGFRVGDAPDSVRENYRLVADDLSLCYDSMVLSRQTHTDHIRIVGREDSGKGLCKESDIRDTDGLICNLPKIPLVVFTADCVPLLFLDPVQKVVAAVHAGWKGTVKGIAAKTVLLMQSHFHSDPKDILTAVGPSIGPCCFAFGREDAKVFPDAYLRPYSDGKVLVDLWQMNRDQLRSVGVRDEHIDISNICTICHAEQYYSYRTQKEHTGRQGAVIMLK